MTLGGGARFLAAAALAFSLATASAVRAADAAPRAKGLCLNYGHDSYVHDLSPQGVVDRDFTRIWNGGVRCLRIVYNGFNDVQAEGLARFAKARGFYVIIGGEWGMLDPSQLVDYRMGVIKAATWAQQNHIDQFSVGNEQEARLSGISFVQWASEVAGLAAEVHVVFSGIVSYEAPGQFADDWAQINIGSLDLLGLNLYGGYPYDAQALRENIAAHGVSHVYMSETNCDISHVVLCESDAGLAAEMQDDVLRLIREFPDTAFYLYTWRATGTDYALSLVHYPKTLAQLGIK